MHRLALKHRNLPPPVRLLQRFSASTGKYRQGGGAWSGRLCMKRRTLENKFAGNCLARLIHTHWLKRAVSPLPHKARAQRKFMGIWKVCVVIKLAGVSPRSSSLKYFELVEKSARIQC
eukprot:1140616-Pelagomonas_calceolata.AAC.1